VENEFKPSRREALHDNSELCKLNLERVVSAVSLEIRPSKIHNMGSGLFVSSEIGAGREIYHVLPMMHAVKPGNDNYCHHCLKDTGDMLGRPPQTVKAMPCARCKIARYCSKDVIGYALDMVTAMINHSCAPNAFVTLEGCQLRVRSLKPIAAGEEITVSYADPTLPVFNRQKFLKETYFFDCRCKGCENDDREQLGLAGTSKNILKLQEAQQQIMQIMAYTVQASQYPGSYPPDLQNLESVETKLRTITAAAVLRNEPYLEHVQPLPSVRRSLAMLYLEKGKPLPALRNALKGCLRKTDKGEPRWVNDMIDPVYTALLVAGSLPPDAPAFKDKAFPSALELRIVTLGFIIAVANEAVKVFGDDCEYATGIMDMATTMGAQKPPPNPGTAEFVAEFVPAQRKLLAWAGVSEEHAVSIPGM
ncbi:hypothetical protein MYCTH_33039, partial [Thermothelomyces thermophilus ATCC 42464]